MLVFPCCLPWRWRRWLHHEAQSDGTGGQAEAVWERQGWKAWLQSRNDPEIKKVIKRREAELKGHVRAAMW